MKTTFASLFIMKGIKQVKAKLFGEAFQGYDNEETDHK